MTNTHTSPDNITLPRAVCARYFLMVTYIFAPKGSVFTPAFLDSILTHVTGNKLGRLSFESFATWNGSIF